MVTVIFTVVTLAGITGLSVLGVTSAQIGTISTLGIGLGTAVSAIIAVLKKRKVA